MTSTNASVSQGELHDKISILEIKACRLRAPAPRANAAAELALLRQGLTQPLPPPALRAALRAVNTRLWVIEDRIREREAAGDFGAGFIALARRVYHENDERSRIKQTLNRLLGSDIIEEKQHPRY